MIWGRGFGGAAAAVLVLAYLPLQPAIAQEATATAQSPAPTAQVDTPSQPPLDACAAALAAQRQGTCIPALTPVQIELSEPLSSRSSVTGQTFGLALASPISIGGNALIAAGAKGQGEVVHAKKTGVGVGGELVLAARFLQIGEQRLRLRSMHLNGAGRDQQGLAFAVGVAVGFPALFVRGKHIDVPVGAFADAKTAEAFWVDAPADAPEKPGEPAPIEKVVTKEGVSNVP